ELDAAVLQIILDEAVALAAGNWAARLPWCRRPSCSTAEPARCDRQRSRICRICDHGTGRHRVAIRAWTEDHHAAREWETRLVVVAGFGLRGARWLRRCNLRTHLGVRVGRGLKLLLCLRGFPGLFPSRLFGGLLDFPGLFEGSAEGTLCGCRG